MTDRDRFVRQPTRRLPPGLLHCAAVPLFVAIVAACSEKGAATQESAGPPPIPVRTAMVEEKAAPVLIQAIGNVEAYSTVDIKAQIEGQIEEVGFREGQFVTKGDLLFRIDARPFQAALRKAEANRARNEAELENAKAEAERVTKLHEKGLSSSDEYDLARTRLDAVKASVLADAAAVEDARLDLEYCSIHSPVDGRTGSLLVNAGNVVKAREVTLVTIRQVQPIYVSFSVSEKHLEAIRSRMERSPLEVQAIPPGAVDPERGVLSFVDNTVDRQTGSIRLKATFDNENLRLWPGQYVSATTILAADARAFVVPTEALAVSQTGAYVFVVKRPELTVEMRPVIPGRSAGKDGAETVVEGGLAPGEEVVKDGQMRLVPGARVEVVTERT